MLGILAVVRQHKLTLGDMSCCWATWADIRQGTSDGGELMTVCVHESFREQGTMSNALAEVISPPKGS